MTNLEKILDRIRADGEERVKALEEETQREIARLDEEDEALLREETDRIARAADADVQKILTLARSSAVSLRKKRVLEAKSRALEESIAAVKTRLAALPEGDYVDLILTLIARSAEDGEGTVYLAGGRPVADREGFRRALSSLPAGKKLTLAEETAPLATGVLIRRGLIDLDLSFEAVIEERRDAIRDRLGDLVFRDAAKE
ncbi:MAG: V-type ATP synthase subunit E [Clostridia bacterium]|nr:V-type ATP synthase subunit E [Clostridia bacterium]